jgi:hypothetical protein
VKKKTDADQVALSITEITKAKAGEDFDIHPIITCTNKFRNIAKNGANLKSHYPRLIKAIDEAILKFYPHKGYWDNGHRSQLLLMYVAIMERIRNGDPVEITEYDKALGFCDAVKSGFEKFARENIVSVRTSDKL